MAYQGDPDLETIQSFFHHFGEGDTLMVFTGLKDKKKKKIYESDLIKDNDGSVWLVRWYPEEACFVFQNPFDKSNFNTLAWLSDSEVIELVKCQIRDCEVVGNIYENPELISRRRSAVA